MKLSFRFSFLFLLVLISKIGFIEAKPYPIQFSIPEEKIVKQIPEKKTDFAFIIPGDLKTYIYQREKEYYKGYQRAFFGVTCKKGGWDCMRHYEILANGCIPYFVDLDRCDENTMYFLPRELIQEAMNLEGVSYRHIDHTKFDREKYDEILRKLIEYTREHLTTKKMAEYILKTVDYKGKGKILCLSKDLAPDYLRCLTLIGLKELLGNRIIDVPKINHIYTNYDKDVINLYGRGMTYTKIVPDLPVDRENIEERIANKEFDLIIYGSVHRGMPFYDLVLETYEAEKIVYICGEDSHYCKLAHLPNFFLREYEAYHPTQ